MPSVIEFRFDAAAHEYTLANGRPLPHITGMLKRAGLIDDRWFTEESSERGRLVHSLTADYDLGALEPEGCVSRHRGYLLAHAAAMKILRPDVLEVEVPRVHPAFLFGGRIDRVFRIARQLTIYEIKSGVFEKSHQIQTALQAILASAEYALPPEAWTRMCAYYTSKGRFKIEQHDKRADFDEAYRVIRKCCA